MGLKQLKNKIPCPNEADAWGLGLGSDWAEGRGGGHDPTQRRYPPKRKDEIQLLLISNEKGREILKTLPKIEKQRKNIVKRDAHKN